MERRTIERVDTGERLTLKYHDGFTGYSTESVYEGRTFKDYGDGRLYEFGSNGGVEGSEWRWASVMEVNYAHDWLGREAEHLDAEKLALAEKLLRERHIELCRERGVEPLDLSECSITVWSGETCVTLNHPTHGIIASAVLLA